MPLNIFTQDETSPQVPDPPESESKHQAGYQQNSQQSNTETQNRTDPTSAAKHKPKRGYWKGLFAGTKDF